MNGPAGYVEFEFDLPAALLAELHTVFERMDAAPLTADAARAIPEAQGVYQLHHAGHLVYIGKTDAQSGLARRLERHAWSVQHRQNLDPQLVTFKAVRVFVFTAVDLETQLVAHYKAAGSLPTWNGSGFGANDPGRKRDHTAVAVQGFDAQFPIGIDEQLTLNLAASAARNMLVRLRTTLPYVFRFQTHADLDTQVTVPPDPQTARSIVTHVVAALPPGWQATALPGRLLLYRETEDYAHGTVVTRS